MSHSENKKNATREKLIASLTEEQRHLYYEAELARHDAQLAELYEITRGIVSWPRLVKALSALAMMIGVMMTISKGAEIVSNIIISNNERKEYYNHVDYNKGEKS